MAASLLVLPVVASAGEIVGSIGFPKSVDRSTSPAIIYIVTKGLSRAESPHDGVVDQRKLQFVPRVQAVALGASVRFENSDNEAHNVKSVTQTSCCSFNEMIGRGKSFEIRPERAGVIKLLCDIHHHMRGFVVVCPNSLFAVTDSAGRFRIDGVPPGSHRVAVWQENSKTLMRDVEVIGSTELSFELDLLGGLTSSAAARPAAAARVATTWSDVRRQIADTLDEAIRAAETGQAAQAERLAIKAYRELFEGNDLEIAIKRFRGDARCYDLERMFARIRKPLLSDLAARHDQSDEAAGARERVLQARLELLKELDADISALQAVGIDSRDSLTRSRTVATVATVSAKVDFHAVMADLRSAFDRVEQLAAKGDHGTASTELADAYFDDFHRIEGALGAWNFAQMRKLEAEFFDVRGRLQSGVTADEARSSLARLFANIDRAATSADRSQNGAGVASGFWNAFVILTREGVEALLVVTALLLYLNRMGNAAGKQSLLLGLLAALGAIAATWVLLQWVLARPGVAQELIEGVTSLIATGLLFYVSYWLVSKSEARRWQEFLTRQVGCTNSNGGNWAIALAGFLAVYREGAETILMFQPLLVNPTPGGAIGAASGIAAAAAALVAIFFCLRFAAFRLAIRPFFRVTGAMLFLLAIAFAGKGIAELQEAEVLNFTSAPRLFGDAVLWIPASVRDLLGLAQTSMQSIVVQLTLAAGAVLSLAALWLVGRLAPLADATTANPAVS